jgi:hypothetical protein
MEHPLDRPLNASQRGAIDAAQRLRGMLVGSYAQIEFLIGHLCESMSKVEPYAALGEGFPFRAENRIRVARKYFALENAPLYKFRDAAQALLDELADHERTRHFMAHGYMDLSSDGRGGYKVLVRCYRPKSPGDPNEEQIRWTLDEMEAEANRASEFCGRWIRLQYDIHADFGWVVGRD